MLGNFERSVRPIVVLNQEEFKACVDLVDKISQTEWAAKGKSPTELSPKISIKLENGDNFNTRSIDDFFQFENKSSNPITEVTISKGSFGSDYIRIELGGGWSSDFGARITIHGSREFSSRIISEFEKITKKEKSINEIIPSLRARNISLILILSIYFFSLDLTTIFNKARDIPLPLIVLNIATLVAAPTAVLAFIVNIAQSRVFGRAVFYWSDGATRYDKARTIVNYLFWFIPTSLAIKSLHIF